MCDLIHDPAGLSVIGSQTRTAVCQDCDTEFEGTACLACAAAHAQDEDHRVTFTVSYAFAGSTPDDTLDADQLATIDFGDDRLKQACIANITCRASCNDCAHAFTADIDSDPDAIDEQPLELIGTHANAYGHDGSGQIEVLFDGAEPPEEESDDEPERATLY